MSKHFIDSDMWELPAFMDAKPNHKLLAIFMMSKCDCAGVFRFNPRVASVVLGFSVTEHDVLMSPVDIRKISDFTFWLEKYCKHQYGTLKSSCRAHLSVFGILARFSLLGLVDVDPDFDFTKVKGLPSTFSIDSLSIVYEYPNDRHKEKEKDKEKDSSSTLKVPKSNTGTRAKKDSRAEERTAHIAELKADITAKFPEFPDTWERWEESRRKNHKPLTDTSREGQLQKLLGMTRPIEALQDSINGDWQGIFDPDGKTGVRAPAARTGGFKNQFDHMDEFGAWVKRQGGQQ